MSMYNIIIIYSQVCNLHGGYGFFYKFWQRHNYSETSLQHFNFDGIHSATVAVLVTCVNYVHLMHIIARIRLQHLVHVY